MRLAFALRVLPARSQDARFQRKASFPYRCGTAARCGFPPRSCSFSSTNSDKTDLESKIARLENQMQQQTEMLQLQGDRLEKLTELLVNNSGNLLCMWTARNGAPASRRMFQPTLDLVAKQVNHTCQLSNDTLASMAINGDGFARRERLLREIMQVDNCSWDEAHEKLIEMDLFNEQYYWLETIPYRLGISAAVLGVIGSCLLVFHKPSALFYAEKVAGEDLPEDKDISTMTTNQVGAWTWEWMEPMIGVASFVILCLQFCRSQMLNLKMSAYTKWMMKSRADRLAARYPQYTGAIVRSWAVILPQVNGTFFPVWKRTMLTPDTRKKNYRTGVG